MTLRMTFFSFRAALLVMCASASAQEGNADPQRANALLAEHDYRGAFEAFTNAIAVKPNNGSAYEGRGKARNALKDYRGAIQDFDRATALNPRSAVAFNLRGFARQNVGDHGGAMADYRRAIELDPSYVAALRNRGDLRRDSGDANGAMQDYNRLLQIAPNHEAALFARGYLKIKAGDNAGAVADYDACISVNAKNVGAYMNRGLAKEKLGDRAGALADFRSTLALDPAMANARTRVAVLEASASHTSTERATVPVAGGAETRAEGRPVLSEAPPEGISSAQVTSREEQDRTINPRWVLVNQWTYLPKASGGYGGTRWTCSVSDNASAVDYWASKGGAGKEWLWNHRLNYRWDLPAYLEPGTTVQLQIRQEGAFTPGNAMLSRQVSLSVTQYDGSADPRTPQTSGVFSGSGIGLGATEISERAETPPAKASQPLLLKVPTGWDGQRILVSLSLASIADIRAYAYRQYEWRAGVAGNVNVAAGTGAVTPPATRPEPSRANLVLTVSGGYPGSTVEGASCVLRVDGKERTLVTARDGRAKDLLDVNPRKKPAVEWVRIELGNAASLHRLGEPPHPLHPSPKPWAFPVNRALAIPSGDNPTLRAEAAAPLGLVQVSIVAWDKDAEAWVSTSANLRVYRGRSRLDRDKKMVDLRADQMVGQNPFDLWIPASDKPGHESLTFLAVSDPRNPMQAVRFIPAPPQGNNLPRTLTLGLAPDASTQLSFLLPELRKLLQGAGLSKLDVDRIFSLPVRPGPTARFDESARTIQLPPSLDLSMDEPTATAFHEYAHAIMFVVGRDEGIPPFGRHDTWEVTNPETAWDEGRAHFLGALIPEALGLPANLEGWRQPSSGGPRADVEGKVANALSEHFLNRGLYPDEKAALQTFVQVQSACAKTEGHTPRSIREFLTTLEKVATTSRQRTDAARLLASMR